jgi:hypothetical protein
MTGTPWLLMIGACSRSSGPSAPVIDWALDRSDRASIRTARQSDQTTRAFAFEVHPTADTAVELWLTIGLATVTFQEDGREVTHSAPVSLSAGVVDDGGFALGPADCRGPHYPLTDQGDAQQSLMMLMCTVKARRPNVDGLFTLVVAGDGRVSE